MAELLPRTGLAFDDILLAPAYSEVLPREVNVCTEIAPGLTLDIPII